MSRLRRVGPMCLAVPGRVERIDADLLGVPSGIVSFGGIRKEVCLAYVPEARVGDYVLVHVGFAIGTIDPARAEATLLALSPPDGDPEVPPGGAAP